MIIDILVRARLAMADTNPDTQEAKLKSVRRRLNFGDTNDELSPTREELDRQFEEERAKQLEEKKSKWNFDFEKEEPLVGRWEWERVDQSSEKSINDITKAPGNADVDVQRNVDAENQAP